VQYTTSAIGLVIDLASSTQQDGLGGVDTLANIEGVEGTQYDDLIYGTDGDNSLDGRFGNNVIDGRLGFDFVEYNGGGRTQLTVNLDAGTASFIRASNGTGYTDSLLNIEGVVGSSTADSITGDDSDNRLYGSGGDDNIYGGEGNDLLDGGAGDDVLKGGAGDDIINDGVGYDTIDGGLGIDTYQRNFSLDYSDYLFVVNIDLEKGTITSADFPDAAPDYIQNVENVTAEGSFHYIITGDSNNNYILTDVGDDILDGGAGDDVLVGRGGDDELTAGSGNDWIQAGDGEDIIHLVSTDVWSAQYYAQNVDTNLSYGTGEKVSIDGMLKHNHVVDGGLNDDILYLQDGNDAFFLDDMFSGFNTHSLEAAGQVSVGRIANIEELRAGDGDDIIDLTSLVYSLVDNTSIYGEGGNDHLWAADGNDNIYGGDGNDSINGGAGNDVLSGDAGADKFQFTATSGADQIVDFQVSEGDELHFYYQTSATSDNTDLSLDTGVLTWNSGDVGQVVTIDLSDTFTSNDIGDLTGHIVFSEIV
jgi:Ca2+-binding RTX toxin-like protein